MSSKVNDLELSSQVDDTKEQADLEIESEVQVNQDSSSHTPKSRKRRGAEDVSQNLDSRFGTEKEKQYRLAYLKLKKYTKTTTEDLAVRSCAKNGFQGSADFPYILTQTISSSVDKYENYPYKGFPYKRAVKLSFDTDGSAFVETSDDSNVYGMCVDVDEYTETAQVVPITNNVSGYFICADSSIQCGDHLDFNSEGELVKASSNLPTSINIIALSNTYKHDFRTPAEQRDSSFSSSSDFIIYFAKVTIFGNKAIQRKS
ncbi:hypothetical protein BDCR2A_01690 [Borrelia duttonii CR2A]|uniref:Uncharacterized protein n=1 Tax=Borrelia duttonii CR2A TaxID=1432657 RepID=W6TWA0_9SPIR|nr:DUF228 domain-containing protein [Borrelia duttonii]ETZ17396.1 hypothetical protein BDCR2A_01690 [Borrelia duttonii CR2A]